VSLVARLTWQAAEPAVLAGTLGRRLGIAAEPGGLVDGAHLLRLGPYLLEVRPWSREGPDDRPRTAGRLVLEPVPEVEEPLAPEPAPAAGMSLHGLGWGTVELARAEGELDMWLAPAPAAPPEGVVPDAAGDLADETLAARARLRAGGALPGRWMALLEPAAEGRAAAALARDGEGPIALYLRPEAGLDAWLERARASGVTASSPRAGPFGPQVLLQGARTGPHVLVTEGRDPVSGGPPAGTIAP
jgi:hypothetical protein